MKLQQLTEDRKVTVEIPSEYSEKAQDARIAASYITQKPWGDETQFYGARWKLQLVEIRDSYGEITYKYNVIPIVGRTTQEKVPWGDYYRDIIIYKEHPNAIDEIKGRPNYVYRGMAMEEWITSKKRGYLQSAGSHNLEQEGLTFYGTADTATYYASGFAPVSFKPGRQKPGVVVEIPKEYVMDHTQHDEIPNGEFAHKGKLPIDAIQRYWLVVPARVRPGLVEVIKNYKGYREGSRSDPSVSYQIIPQ